MNGPENRLMGTRCNATMLTRLIGTKHGVQLWLMRASFVWQLNVIHTILLQPRSACYHKLGLSARLVTQPQVIQHLVRYYHLKQNELLYSNMIEGFLIILDFIHVYDGVVLKSYNFLLHNLQSHCLIFKVPTLETLQAVMRYGHSDNADKHIC